MKRIKILRICTVICLTFLLAVSWVGQAEGALVTGTSSNISDSIIIKPPLQLTPLAPTELMVRNFPGILPVDLEWQDNSLNETGFTIERSTNGSSYASVGTVRAGVTSFTDTTVTRDMKCTYRVYANSSSGKSANSNEVEWITVPNKPSNLVGYLDSTKRAVNLDWQGNNSYARYKITKTTVTTDNKTSIEALNVAEGALSHFEDKNIAPGNTYTYFVTAVSSAGSTEGSNKVTISYPGAPSNVMVSSFPGSSKLTVKWQDNSSNEAKFRIEKAHSNEGGITSKEVAANITEFEDDVWVDRLYMYRVAAVSSDGTLSPYSEVYYWYAPPQYPDGVKATAVSGSEVQLTWNDRSAHETSFKIVRKGDKAVVPIEVGANTTTYSDKGLKADTAYTYTIYAFNATSNTISEYFPEVSVTTLKAITNPGALIPKGGLIPAGLKLDIVLQIGSPNMMVNGSSQEIDPGVNTAPVILGGSTFLPIRAVLEAYGGTLEWKGTERKVVVVCNGHTVELWIDSVNTKVDGRSITAQAAPRIINNRTMLPLRFISENIGLDVNWDAATKQVTIATGN